MGATLLGVGLSASAVAFVAVVSGVVFGAIFGVASYMCSKPSTEIKGEPTPVAVSQKKESADNGSAALQL